MNYVDMGLEAITQKPHTITGAEVPPPSAPASQRAIAIGFYSTVGLVGACIVGCGYLAWRSVGSILQGAPPGEYPKYDPTGSGPQSPLEERRAARKQKQSAARLAHEAHLAQGPAERHAQEAATLALAAARRRAAGIGAPTFVEAIQDIAAKGEGKKKKKKQPIPVRSWERIGTNPDGTPQFADVCRWVDPTPTEAQAAASKEQSRREQEKVAQRLIAVNAARAAIHQVTVGPGRVEEYPEGLPPIIPPSEGPGADPEGWRIFRQELRDWEDRIKAYAGQTPMGRHCPGQDPWHAKSTTRMRCHDDAGGTGQGQMRPSGYYPSRKR